MTTKTCRRCAHCENGADPGEDRAVMVCLWPRQQAEEFGPAAAVICSAFQADAYEDDRERTQTQEDLPL